jgi:hypothetical protein
MRSRAVPEARLLKSDIPNIAMIGFLGPDGPRPGKLLHPLRVLDPTISSHIWPSARLELHRQQLLVLLMLPDLLIFLIM